MNIIQKIIVTTLAIFLIFLIGCQKQVNDPVSQKISEDLKQQKKTLLIKGGAPGVKLENLINRLNGKWPKYIWISGNYMLNPLAMSTKVSLDIGIYREPSEIDPEIDRVVGEVVWHIAQEIRPKEISVTLFKLDGIDNFYFLNSGEEIRGQEIKPGESIEWRRHLASTTSNSFFVFPVDSPVRNFYKMSWRQVQDPPLKKLIDNWNKRWLGGVFVHGEDSTTYFVRLGFKSISAAEYIEEANKILGEIIYDSLEILPAENLRIFVLHANGDAYYHYNKEDGFIQMKKYMAEMPKAAVLDDWSGFFIVEPFVIKFTK